nr:MAG TPA: hypothetical protein [Caudoviricetes sp.]
MTTVGYNSIMLLLLHHGQNISINLLCINV